MKKYTFTGVASGDFEGFCWDVDIKTFKRLIGRKPGKYCGSKFCKGLYRLYIEDLVNIENLGHKFKVTIELKDLNETKKPARRGKNG